MLLFALLICSDEGCAEELEAWGELEELDTLACVGCGCALQPLAYFEARPAEAHAPLRRQPANRPAVQLRDAA